MGDCPHSHFHYYYPQRYEPLPEDEYTGQPVIQTESLLFCIPFFTLLIPSHPASIQIQDITNNARALILQRGEGRIIAGYDRLLHIIDFPPFEISLSIIESVIGQLRNSSSDFSEIIRTKLRKIKFIFSTLHVKLYRNKRSTNMLGSAIKFITGNLDSEDLRLINTNLDELRKTGNTLIKQNNR